MSISRSTILVVEFVLGTHTKVVIDVECQHEVEAGDGILQLAAGQLTDLVDPVIDGIAMGEGQGGCFLQAVAMEQISAQGGSELGAVLCIVGQQRLEALVPHLRQQWGIPEGKEQTVRSYVLKGQVLLLREAGHSGSGGCLAEGGWQFGEVCVNAAFSIMEGFGRRGISHELRQHGCLGFVVPGRAQQQELMVQEKEYIRKMQVIELAFPGQQQTLLLGRFGQIRWEDSQGKWLVLDSMPLQLLTVFFSWPLLEEDVPEQCLTGLLLLLGEQKSAAVVLHDGSQMDLPGHRDQWKMLFLA